MRKLFFIKNLSILLLITLKGLSQGDNSYKFDVSIGGGLSYPVGSFGANNPSKSAIYIVGAPAVTVKGFAKDKSGFAMTGYNYNIMVKYKLTRNLRLLFLVGSNNNGVRTNDMSDFLTTLYGNKETKVEEVNYKIVYFTPGIGYYLSLNSFDFGMNLFMGYSVATYPYYKFIFLYTSLDPPPIFSHVGAKPNLGAFTFGSSLSASYDFSKRFKIGIDLLFQSATFAYNLHPENYPGGGGSNFDFSDKLKVRTVNTLLNFGYRF